MDRGCFKVSVAWCCQRSKTEYLEADDGISSKALVGGHPPRSPLPPRLQTVAEAKEFASPLGVRVCESLHEKQDRK